MIRPHTCWRAAVILVAVVLTLAGCRKGANKYSEDEKDPQHYELFEIGHLLDMYATDKNRPAAKVADLQPYGDAYTNGFQAVESGKCIVVWSVDPRKKDANAVMAYQKDAPTQGGFVLLGNKQIKKMTADEFKALYKGK